MSKHAGRAPHRRARRANVTVTTIAVAVGLWLGLTAPTVSPVAPVPGPVAVAPGTGL